MLPKSKMNKRQLGAAMDTKFADGRANEPQKGFTLVEVVIAMLIIMVSFLGVFATFTYAIQYNAGNKSRSQALSLLQEEVEKIRAAKFTSNGAPDAVLLGGQQPARAVTLPDGRAYSVTINVDNDPTVPGWQGESHVCQSPQGAAIPCTIKEIEVTVRLASPTAGWQVAVPVRVLMRRVRGN
jgi:prepilin-type N-terminal cleavage/methylation domain-containing protein